jgi:hypothetical protein
MGRPRIGVVLVVLTLAGAVSMLPLQVATAVPLSTTVIIPSNNATVSGTSQVLDASTSSRAHEVQFEITGGTLTDSVVATAARTIYGWLATWDTTTVANGTYALQSVAAHAHGASKTSAPVSITVDNPPPSTTVVYPASGATLDGMQPQPFDAVASPGVTEVTFDLIAGGGNSFTFSATPTLDGWIAVLPGETGTCGPAPLPFTVESIASYAGGVSGTSAPVPITIDVYTAPVVGC